MNKGLEFSMLDSWDEWDELDSGDMLFTGVKVKQEVQKYLGEFQAASMALISSKSIVEFYDAQGEYLTLDVELQIKEDD